MEETTLLYHIGMVLSALAFLSYIGRCCGPVAYIIAFLYLCLVHQRCNMRLRMKIQFRAKKKANQRRLLSDFESVNWLNHAIAQVWPICMENVASQQLLLPIIPWFLDKYKPWTARKAVVQHLYLGKTPPLITDMRVIRRSADDDHLVLELGLNFLSGNDMSAILAVKLRKRLGFGLWTKMHVTGMHVEGKVLVGVKFLDRWPFLSRIRVSFVGPPYFQMTAKPIFQHGLDVTELPGIAGWLDKILSVAFEQSLVEPNMLVVDVEKFVSAPAEPWFKVDEKPPIAHAKVEIIEGANMKPSDMNGLSDPYVKGQLGPFCFRTKIQKKTLNPKWFEEYMIPINSWEASSTLVLEVRDKDRIFDDSLGDCTVNLRELKAGQRHERWLPLQNIKMGRLHLALTIIEGGDNKEHPKEGDGQLKINEDTGQTDENIHRLQASSEHGSKNSDEFEPIPIEGTSKTGVWVHHPGDIVPQKWESRKGRLRQGNTEVQCEDADSPRLATTRFQCNETDIIEDNNDNKKINGDGKIRKAIRKIGSFFNKNHKNDYDVMDERVDIVMTPRPNLRASGEKNCNLKLVIDDIKVEDLNELQSDLSNDQLSEDADQDIPGKSQVKDVGKGIIKQAGEIARKSFKKGKERKEICYNRLANDSSNEDSSPSSSSNLTVKGASMSSSRDDKSVHKGVRCTDIAAASRDIPPSPGSNSPLGRAGRSDPQLNSTGTKGLSNAKAENVVQSPVLTKSPGLSHIIRKVTFEESVPEAADTAASQDDKATDVSVLPHPVEIST